MSVGESEAGGPGEYCLSSLASFLLILFCPIGPASPPPQSPRPQAAHETKIPVSALKINIFC